MRAYLTAPLFLALGLIHPGTTSFSALPEDLEGSGYDLDSSGSGDWSEQDEVNVKDPSTSKDVRILTAGGGTDDAYNGLSVLTFDDKQWPVEDSGSGFVVLANSKSFLEREDVFAGVIAGAVIGVIFAATLAGILIYKWQKKDDGYVLGQQSASDDYHKPKRDKGKEVI